MRITKRQNAQLNEWKRRKWTCSHSQMQCVTKHMWAPCETWRCYCHTYTGAHICNAVMVYISWCPILVWLGVWFACIRLEDNKSTETLHFLHFFHTQSNNLEKNYSKLYRYTGERFFEYENALSGFGFTQLSMKGTSMSGLVHTQLAIISAHFSHNKFHLIGLYYYIVICWLANFSHDSLPIRSHLT